MVLRSYYKLTQELLLGDLTINFTQQNLEKIYLSVATSEPIEPYEETPVEEEYLKKAVAPAGEIIEGNKVTKKDINYKLYHPFEKDNILPLMRYRNEIVLLLNHRETYNGEQDKKIVDNLIMNRVAIVQKLCLSSLDEKNTDTKTLILQDLYKNISEITKPKLESIYSDENLNFKGFSTWLNEYVLLHRINQIFNPFVELFRLNIQ